VTSFQDRHKRYAVSDSPFFKLKGKGQLEKLLCIDIKQSSKLFDPSNYRVWTNDKDREIQAPKNWLEQVHKRIASLLSRIEVPDYVFSQKGRSNVSNAWRHRGNVPLIKTDINKFYPSTTRSKVVRLFLEEFQCASDIANILADICCYRQEKLPTGSPLSGYVAFLAARPMFDRIDLLARANNAKFSLLVDDITISGPNVGLQLLLEVRRIVRHSGYKTRGGKSKTYSALRPKPVTGAIISGRRLLLPNKQHASIHATKTKLTVAPTIDKPRVKARLRGQLVAADQVLNHRANLVKTRIIRSY
jgi:hypothetical protein